MTTSELDGYAALVARALVSMCVAGLRSRRARTHGVEEHPRRNVWPAERIEA